MRNTLLTSTLGLCGLLYAGGAVAQTATINSLLPDQRALAGNVNAETGPEPGTVQIRLGGHSNFYAVAISESGNKAPGYKQANYGFADDVHLNPSVDGVAANGLRYGTFIDIWQEKPTPSGGGSAGAIATQDTVAGTPYIRRMWVYMGLPTVGTLRVGSGDSPAGLFETGTFQNFNEGGWDGDVPGEISANVRPTWPFALVGNIYTPTKITYLSPQIYGFEFGISYEPNTSQFTYFDGACPTASTGCARLSTSSNTADLARRRNMVDPEIRYRGVFGPVGVALQAGYMFSGVVQAGSGIPSSYTTRYRGFGMGIGGIAITYGGLTVGGHAMAGTFNGQWGLSPVGGSTSVAALGGASYTIGPVIVGASYYQYDSPGNSFQTAGPTVGQLRERGFAAGGTYTVVPGLSIFLDYLNGGRKENGFDLLNGGASKLNNETRAQLIGVGTQLRW